MVKLTEVEDEHFTSEKPVPTNKDALLASDNEDDDDYTDTGMLAFFLIFLWKSLACNGRSSCH